MPNASFDSPEDYYLISFQSLHTNNALPLGVYSLSWYLAAEDGLPWKQHLGLGNMKVEEERHWNHSILYYSSKTSNYSYYVSSRPP